MLKILYSSSYHTALHTTPRSLSEHRVRCCEAIVCWCHNSICGAHTGMQRSSVATSYHACSRARIGQPSAVPIRHRSRYVRYPATRVSLEDKHEPHCTSGRLPTNTVKGRSHNPHSREIGSAHSVSRVQHMHAELNPPILRLLGTAFGALCLDLLTGDLGAPRVPLRGSQPCTT